MTNFYGSQPQPPRGKKPNKLVIVLMILVGIVGVLLCCGSGIGLVTGADPDAKGLSVSTAEDAPAGSATAPAVKVKSKPTSAPPSKLTKATIQLTVKTTSKECFGSAGCIVQWQIKAGVTDSVHIEDPCDVTYEVRGLTETQTHTLTVKDDKTYEQDGYQSGQTSSSGKKLTAVVTEVECG